MKRETCELLVIGAGPGGYVCGIRAGQLGVDAIVVNANEPGGTCLNVGCIPSKALIHAATEFHKASRISSDNILGISASAPTIDLAQTVAWKDGIVTRLNRGVSGLLKKANTRLINGRAMVVDGKTVDVVTDDGVQRITCETLVIATGSAPVELPFLPFQGNVMSSTEALSLTRLPETMTVVGGGYIGLEIGTAYAKLGSNVTVVEAADRILPQYDAALTKPVVARLNELGVTLHLNAKAKGMTEDETALRIDAGGTELQIPSDKVLVTVGRKPVLTGFGLEDLGLAQTGPFLAIDARCQTSMRGVYAVGDVTGEPMLAHRAIAQGEMVAEIVAGGRHSWDKRCIPAVCFTDPEIVTVGLGPDEAKAEGHEIITAQFPFSANGRAMTMENESGFVRIVARKDDHVLLGIQAVGSEISELSAAFAMVIEMGGRIEDVAGTIHAHPTQSEGFQEAALKSLGQALHI